MIVQAAGTDGRRRFTAMLRRHGVRGATAQATHRISTELVRLTRQTEREFAGAVDIDSGAALPDILGGGQDEVDLSEQLAAMAPEHRYIQIHTHPGDSSFSETDIAIVLSHPVLAAMVVLGQDGAAYLLSKTLIRQSAPFLTVVVEWNRAFYATFGRYEAMVRNGELTERGAMRLHTHAVTRTIARRFRLRYSRITGAF
jgi:hypothetical protein